MTTGTDSPSPIDELYRRHVAGDVLTDPEWLEVDRILMGAAMVAVRRSASRYKVPERTHRELGLAVKNRLFIKVHGKKVKPRGGLTRMLPVMGFHATISELRRIRGVMACQFDGVGETGLRSRRHETPEGDDYETLRAMLPDPRFAEYRQARDMLLAHFAMTGTFPGPDALKSVVPGPMLQTVFNASLVEINMAVESLEAVHA